MGALADVFERIFGDREDEIREALLAQNDGEAEEIEEVDFGEELPGEAADSFEVFLAGATAVKVKGSDLLWYPMIRSGQWAVRPGPAGKKVKRALKVIAGKSKDQRKEIGLEDLKTAFDDQAVEYVTVPESHENKTLENTGFIREMKILDAEVQTGPSKGTKVPTLFGGYHFTDKKAKKKVEEGSVAGRSCGILYDYINTETGKKYPAVIEHVALTNKPWITGMVPFGRKLSMSEDLEPIALSLSDEKPEIEIDFDHKITVDLAEASASITWPHEDSPNWLRQQVDQVLREARAEKYKARRNQNQQTLYVEDVIPYYRCVEAKPGQALIADGYGDDANFWVASFQVEDGQVSLDEFKEWQAAKKVYAIDDRKPPDKKKEPLAEPAQIDDTPRGRLRLAQARRRARTSGESPADTTTTPPGGEQNKMDGENSNSSTLALSEEARKAIADAEARAKAAEDKATDLTRTVDRLTGSVHGGTVATFLGELKDMGFDEAHGFGGMLVEMETVLLNDDLEEVVVSEKFSQDGQTEVGLSLTDAFKRVFGAIKKGEDGKIKLGEQVEQPPSEETGKPGEGGSSEAASSESGSGEAGSSESGSGAGSGSETPAGSKPTNDGKPAAEAGSGEGSSLSTEEKIEKGLEEAPELARLVGGGKPSEKAGSNGTSEKGGEK